MVAPHFRTADEADFIFRAADLPWERLKVTGFTGTEGISELFEFTIDLASDDPDVPGGQLLGKPCTLEIAGPSGSRYVNGIVRKFARTGDGSKLTYYSAVMAPVHWLLTKRYASRIFQESNCEDMTVPGIIKKVLADAGVPDDNVRFALQGTYPKREYVVQYRETEMNFISRLMEDEGIFYFFEHADENHKMVIGDDPAAHPSNPLQATYPFRSPSGLVPEKEQFFDVRMATEIQTGSVTLEDFDFKKPAVDLRAKVDGDDFTALEFSEYPGLHEERAEGERYAKLRLEENGWKRLVVDMKGTARALIPGFKFTLVEHPREPLNGEFLPLRVVHHALQLGSTEEEAPGDHGMEYMPEVRAIPAETPFRAPRETPRPIIHGSQTAIVVGPKEEEIFTDKYGRVKVQFHWDREGTYTEDSSCWIRVSQAAAGGQYGFMYLPRIGQEVIVEFLDGNPDRPIITGRVYNGDLMPPYALPAERTKIVLKGNSSKGGGGCNELRFEDLKDKEQILIQAQRQMDLRVKAGHFHTTGAYDLIVGGEDQYGNLYGGYLQLVHKEKRTHVKDYREMWIEGDEQYFVDGLQYINVDNNRLDVVTGNVREEYGNHSEQTGAFSVNAGTIKLEADSGIELVCGGSSVVVAPGGVYINGPTIFINSGAGPSQPAAPNVASPAVTEADPAAADRSDPGKDQRYDGGGVTVPPIETEPLKERRTIVEIQVVDASREQRPKSGENVRIKTPSGEIMNGVTDAEGVARFENIEPAGNCELNLPDRDDDTWHHLRFEPAT